MCAIVGIAGLQPTLDSIKISKTVAIANKESIICAWNILSREIKKYKTIIQPVDSEHFSILKYILRFSSTDVNVTPQCITISK